MKKLHTENISTTRGSPHSSSPTGESVQGFPRVVVDGSFVRVDKSKPFMARMVSSDSFITSTTDEHSDSKHTLAILESVSCNLEAGMEMLDSQENSLAPHPLLLILKAPLLYILLNHRYTLYQLHGLNIL